MALTDRDKRAVMILGGVAGAAILIFLLLNVLGGGGGGEVASTGPTASGPVIVPSPSVSVSPSPRFSVPPIITFAGRDPFSIPPSLLSPSSAGSPGPSGSGSGSGPPPSGTGSPSFTPTSPSNGSSKTIGGHTVTLDSVFMRNGQAKVTVDVDGTIYVRGEGDSFASNYQVTSIDTGSNCATFLYASESFTLCSQSPK
jgi:hypothetical protein